MRQRASRHDPRGAVIEEWQPQPPQRLQGLKAGAPRECKVSADAATELPL